MLHKDNKEDGDDLDFRAVENGFVSLVLLCFLAKSVSMANGDISSQSERIGVLES